MSTVPPTAVVPAFDVAVLAPALNESGNVGPLVEQIDTAFADSGLRLQIIIVNDGSTDRTADELEALRSHFPHLLTPHHDTPRGQSASLHTGIHAADADCVCTLDADLQNDPADLPRMVALLREHDADLVQGDRSANRRDHALRKAATHVGRFARRVIVGDATRDTGCATRALTVRAARRLPLDRPGMHRFIPACVAGLGGKVIETPVNHRPRHHGKTKYGTGLLKRGLPGLRDCFAVRAMIRRSRQANPRQLNVPASV